MSEASVPEVTLERLRLPDGRALAWSEFGARGGRPVLYFHGFPGSRLEAGAVARGAERAGVRLISVDRPGFGGSEYQRGRRLLDWPTDVSALADHLGLERFALAGASAGAPYALACAHALPERTSAVGLACPLAPPRVRGLRRGMFRPNRVGLAAAAIGPWFVWPTLALLSRRMLRDAEGAIARLARALPAPDRELLERPELRALFAEVTREAFRGGARGPAREVLVMNQGWGFELSSVTQPVQLWHGERDGVLPVAMGRWLANALPRCEARFFPDEGHYSLVLEHAREFLAGLV